MTLPAGTVTFLLTDVENSTALWRDSPYAREAMTRQEAIVAGAVARHGGVRPRDQGEGDSLLAAFGRASDALAAALDAQRALGAEPWPGDTPLRVRMGLHTGEAELRDEHNYGGTAVIRAARLRSLAHGGQVLVCGATAAVAADRLPDGASLRRLGSVKLAGFSDMQVVHQLCHPELPAQFAPLRRSGATLPAWPTPLIGRERERREVAALLEQARLVTITGAGGAGKTRLAHGVAEQMAEGSSGGVVWVDLARLADGARIVGSVLTACGLSEAPGAAELDVLTGHLARAELLLVLDNCEHLLDDCARLVETVLRAGTAVRVLATSREPLGTPGEVTWRIPSLVVAPADARDPERIAMFDAVQLFVERARAARPDFVLDAVTAPAVARICRRLDGLPLALELAAARVRTLAIERLADGLDDRFRLLTGGARTAVARQRTLVASVEWSHDLLEEAERMLFRRLGVFAAPFDLEAAEAVASDEALDRFAVLDLLGRLVDKSLVQLAGDRYALLETLRQYALERAASAGELGALRERHLAWFRRLAASWTFDHALATAPVLDAVAAALPDLLAALDWSLEQGAPANELLAPLAEHAVRSDVYSDLRALAPKLLGAHEDDPAAWLATLAPVASTLFFAGLLDWMPAAERALESLGEAVPLAIRADVEWALAMPAAFAGLPVGIARVRRAIELARAAGSRALEIKATANLATLLATGGQRADALPLLRWLGRRTPPTAAVGKVVDMAIILTALYDGDFAAAKAHLTARGLEHVGLATVAATVAQATNDRALARQALEAVERRETLGMMAGHGICVRAAAALLADDLSGARDVLRDGLSRPAFGMIAALLRLELVHVCLSLDALDEAAAVLADAEGRLAGTSLVSVQLYAQLARAELAIVHGDHAGAAATIHAALTTAERHEMSLIVVDALELLVRVAAAEGRDVDAARLLGAVEAFHERTGYRRVRLHHRRAVEPLLAAVAPAQLAQGHGMTLADAVGYARRGRGDRKRPAHGWDSLTPAEARVVDLVGAGLPNREIAAKLFVSLATVKTHLVHVYGKLGVRTRAELAVAVARRR